MSSDETAGSDPVELSELGEDEPDLAPDGLELARTLTRAVANASPRARARSRTRSTPRTPRASGAHPDDRDPQLLEGLVGRLVEDRGWQVDLKVQSVLSRWAELVGDQIGDHSTPETFADGKLIVRTDSTAWATQLRLFLPDILRRLNTELGHGTVLEIEVLGPLGPTWKKGPRSIRGARGPRDTYG